MASASERRRRRVLDNSEDRLQKILRIHSHQSVPSSSLSTEKINSSELDLAGAAAEENDEPAIPMPESKFNTGISKTDGESRDEMVSPDVPLCSTVTRSEGIEEQHSSQRRFLCAQEATTSDTSSPSTSVPAETERGVVCNRWIRPVLNASLAVLLILRWTYLHFDSLTADGAGKIKPSGDRLKQNGAIVEQSNESFIWPFLTLQLVLLCVPQLRQTTHSPWISMVTIALQLSGMSVKLTNFLNLILSSMVAALSDLCVFLFVVVLLHDLVTNVAPTL